MTNTRKKLIDYVDAYEASEILNVSYNTIRNMQNDGRLITYVVGSDKRKTAYRLFKRSEVDSLSAT